MELEQYITALAEAGETLAEAAERAGLDARVPTCPEWTVRDLVFHQGGVHRWATEHPRERRSRPARGLAMDPLADAAERPADDELLAWYRAGVNDLVSVLRESPADVECWTFLDAPSPLVFWARRQAMETTIHRVDAELAAGTEVTPFSSELATNGIDELLAGFLIRRKHELRSDEPSTIAVRTTDTGAGWLLTITTEPLVTERGVRPADAEISGPAQDVCLALWNRAPIDGLAISGDGTLVKRWSELAVI